MSAYARSRSTPAAAKSAGKAAKGGKDANGAFDAVFRMVRRIPRGRVMSYGQIANLLEVKLSARAVGWAMNGCPDNVPWQRVVNAAGACSTDLIPGNPVGLQRALLEEEGVEFGPSGKLDLKRYRYTPRGPRKTKVPAKKASKPGAKTTTSKKPAKAAKAAPRRAPARVATRT
jgi:methylated-DNA-protein-cysteine methyltransferase-like protein